ncbi:hypothetical protein ELI23_08990 [Rhizobium leguminosarum]|nr:hypothetical protein [Rhizobium leguminosarum]TAV89332.1 hypothetical protein ELI22_08960 [Rhizobium leguminosarum]TAV93913.1 hypothetical protein ELI21_08950 [Rhizobium leguminosarum]TAW34990.1 hypothetical protein ELI23_08990 [Rhizobium leguminosarum]
MQLIKLAFVVACALSVAACTTTTRVSVSKQNLSGTTRSIVGTSLIGARGATPRDQEKIDDTAAGLCGAGIWTSAECRAHGDASKR